MSLHFKCIHSTVSGFILPRKKTWVQLSLQLLTVYCFKFLFCQNKTWNSWVYTLKSVCTQLFQVFLAKINLKQLSLHFWCMHSNFFSCQNKTWNSWVYTFDVYTQISVLAKIKPEIVESTLLMYTLKFLFLPK